VYAAIGKSRALVSMSRPSRGGNDKHWRLVGISDRGTHPAVRRVRCGIELVCGCRPLDAHRARTAAHLDADRRLVAVEESATGPKPLGLSTGALGAADRVGTSKVPLSACSTQRRSRFTFSPRARATATAATDTPGCWQAATASVRNAALRRRGRSRPIPTACLEVSLVSTVFQVDTYAPIPPSGREAAFACRLRIGRS
jgi:hypothetical protein